MKRYMVRFFYKFCSLFKKEMGVLVEEKKDLLKEYLFLYKEKHNFFKKTMKLSTKIKFE